MYKEGKYQKIKCIIKSILPDQKVHLVKLDNDLIITPAHPIRLKKDWYLPKQLKKPEIIKQEAVYNFIMEEFPIIIVNGIECLTLGEDHKVKVSIHPFYGT